MRGFLRVWWSSLVSEGSTCCLTWRLMVFGDIPTVFYFVFYIQRARIQWTMTFDSLHTSSLRHHFLFMFPHALEMIGPS